jgi:hypothetical protein
MLLERPFSRIEAERAKKKNGSRASTEMAGGGYLMYDACFVGCEFWGRTKSLLKWVYMYIAKWGAGTLLSPFAAMAASSARSSFSLSPGFRPFSAVS